ncbi:MAG: galactose-1-phosphate uridylyltransferase [Geminicoccaceae bacterium]
MAELRHDLLDDRWIICQPERARRASDLRPQGERRVGSAHDCQCPFCPGNEAQLEAILWENRPVPQPLWATRVVANKYPVVRAGSPGEARDEFLAGVHEVVVETPHHDRALADMHASKLTTVIETYRARQRVHAGRAAWVAPFRNHGPSAGTSLFHAHGQLVATDAVPPAVEARERRAERYLEQTGRCYLCDILERERREGARWLGENRAFAAFVPYAAEVRFEIWIAPKAHAADFDRLPDAALRGLASLLREVLRALRDRAGDPDYNLMILSASRARRASAAWHWFLRLRPRTTALGGFELASGIVVNPGWPESDAALLRGRSS